MFKYERLLRLHVQKPETIYNHLFLLNIIIGQNLNKVLKVLIIIEDFYLRAGLIHKQSTSTVEQISHRLYLKIRILEMQNQKNDYCIFHD